MILNSSGMKNIPIDDPKERLIFALDQTRSIADVISWVELLKGHVGMFKVGKEAFTRYGPEVVTKIQTHGEKVFLDLKFHDIPQTVGRATGAAVELGVAMLNVHALGGKGMLREAVQSAGNKAQELGVPKPIVLAVTVLTSLNNSDLSSLGFHMPVEDLVVNLARLSQEEGVSGVVASPQDIVAIRKACGLDFMIVTPGIRGGGAAGDDQKRTLPAGEAVKCGADYVVVGRPIYLASNPAREADAIVREISLYNS
jgi:orotidine-5'-phosphate decarboxylase